MFSGRLSGRKWVGVVGFGRILSVYGGIIRTSLTICIVGILPLCSLDEVRAQDDPEFLIPGLTVADADFLPEVDQDRSILYLALVLNGRDTGFVGEFTLHRASRRFSASRVSLRSAGLKLPFGVSRDIFLDGVDGLSYRYDDISQTIEIDVTQNRLLPQDLSKQGINYEFIDPQLGFGAVLNYKLTTGLGQDILDEGLELNGAFADLEGRIYTPLGVLSTRSAVSASDLSFDDARFTHYDTAFTWSNPSKALSLTVGDFVTSTPPWGRAVRLGGVQFRRNFELRSDIITTPRLTYSGNVAVPSTVEVYVDNVKAWSGQAEAGPFKLSDLPFTTSSGEAVIVTRDSAGREFTERVSFFAGRDVLKAGTLDFSVDSGRARSEFGSSGWEYDNDALLSASLRYGVTDKLMVQGQVEYGKDLTASSIGLTSVVFDAAEVALAYGKSRFRNEHGSIVYGSLRTEVAGINVTLRSLRRSSEYADLAYAIGAEGLPSQAPSLDFERLRPARSTDTLTLDFDNWLDKGAFGISYIRTEQAHEINEIMSVSYSRRLWAKGPSLRIAGFKDMRQGGYGLSLGLAMTLGNKNYVGTGIGRSPAGNGSSYASLSRQVGREVGSTGYRISVTDWHDRAKVGVIGRYRTNFGLAELNLLYDDRRRVSGRASFDGAVVLAGGSVLPGNYIRDGFAVVKVGVPNVPVYLHGQRVARTGIFGDALVPGLQAYRSNRVSVQPDDLPLGGSFEATAMTVVPAHKSGVTVTFGRGAHSSALLTVLGPTGVPLEVGTVVRLSGSREEFVMGYDGELWLDGLKKTNTITGALETGTCTAQFTYEPAQDELTRIRVKCE